MNDAGYSGKAKVGKVDTDANRDTAAKFGIGEIPRLVRLRRTRSE